MEAPRAAAFAVTTRPVQAFRDSKLEARRALLEAKRVTSLNDPLPDRPRGDSDSYRLAQERAMQQWRRYFSDVVRDVNPDQIWLDLCGRGPKKLEAMNYCKWFLEDYVENSERQTLSIESEDHPERSVKRDLTVLHLWRTLVTAADNTILHRKRQIVTDYDPSLWTLTYTDGKARRGSGPVSDIVDWIVVELSATYNLVREQTFVKVAATSTDIIVLLTALWTKAKHIPCRRQNRVDLHKVILLMSLGGFRPGTTVKLKYKQVEVDLVRDPQSTRKEMTPRCNVTIQQNKRIQKKARTSQDEKVKIPLYPTNDPLVCLSTLLLSQAIADDAFAASDSITSLEDLERPREAKYVRLPWKKEMLDREIIQIDYATLLRLWKRLVDVAGCRDPMRPYSMRIGAGGRLDKAFKPAQRNYILSHSTSVFNKNYQPRDLGYNLSTIAFPNHAGGDITEKLSELMRNTSFTWNENAPIYPTQKDLDSFERNSRIRAYRDEYANLKDDCSPEAKKQANRVQSQISKSIDILCARAVERRRDEFWKKVDRRNAEGKGTDDLQTEHINPRKARHQDSIVPATQIGQILSKDNVGSNVFSNSLVAFLKCRDCDIETLLGEDVGSQQPTQLNSSGLSTAPAAKISALSTVLQTGNAISLRSMANTMLHDGPRRRKPPRRRR
ncbi:hypothetical protein MCOR34_003931 [Pyricularia oryzae]|nr:hypothetical protein MCOR34_003931 [Pyricularia oryzae]